jgi:hypothetical protein
VGGGAEAEAGEVGPEVFVLRFVILRSEFLESPIDRNDRQGGRPLYG